MKFVVDTNVAIVANGASNSADTHCQLTCVETLEAVVTRDILAVDDKDDIVQEYARHLDHSGRPGVGDAFYKHVFDNQYRGDRVVRVPVTPSDDDRGYEELPHNAFDPSDRKFLAVAVVAGATVLNATDSDWEEHASLVEELGVEVCQLCPQHASKRARRPH